MLGKKQPILFGQEHTGASTGRMGVTGECWFLSPISDPGRCRRPAWEKRGSRVSGPLLALLGTCCWAADKSLSPISPAPWGSPQAPDLSPRSCAQPPPCLDSCPQRTLQIYCMMAPAARSHPGLGERGWLQPRCLQPGHKPLQTPKQTANLDLAQIHCVFPPGRVGQTIPWPRMR